MGSFRIVFALFSSYNTYNVWSVKRKFQMNQMSSFTTKIITLTNEIPFWLTFVNYKWLSHIVAIHSISVFFHLFFVFLPSHMALAIMLVQSSIRIEYLWRFQNQTKGELSLYNWCQNAILNTQTKSRQKKH